MNIKWPWLWIVTTLQLLLAPLRATTLDSRPSDGDCATVLDAGAWCCGGVDERHVVTGMSTALMPCVSAPKEIVNNARDQVRGSYPFFIKPYDKSKMVAVLGGASASTLMWSNDSKFATSCKQLPNYFQTAVPSDRPFALLSNDWTSVRSCLTNLICTKQNVSWWYRDLFEGWNVALGAWYTADCNLNPTYEYAGQDLDGWFSLDDWWEFAVKANARGSATLTSDPHGWGNDKPWGDRLDYVRNSLFKSFVSGGAGQGFDWPHPMNEYAVCSNPKELVWVANNAYYTVKTNYAAGTTNMVGVQTNLITIGYEGTNYVVTNSIDYHS